MMPLSSPAHRNFAPAMRFWLIAFSWVTMVVLTALAADTGGSNAPLAQLQVSRFWPVNTVELAQAGANHIELGHFLVRSNTIWFGLKYIKPRSDDDDPGRIPFRLGIQALDATSLRPTVSFLDLPGSFQAGGAFFDLAGPYLYAVAGSTRIRRFDLTGQQYRDYPVVLPADMPVTLAAVENVLLICAADRLLEMDPATGKVKILFSRRRFPVETELDSLDLRAPPTLLRATEQVFDFRMLTKEGGNVCYTFDRTKGIWRSRTDLAPGGATLVKTGESGRIWGHDGFWLMRSNGEATPLIAQHNPPHAVWKLDPVSTLAGDRAFRVPWSLLFYDGSNMVGVLPAAYFDQSQQLTFDRGRQASLWWYDHRWDTAMEFDLKFILPEAYQKSRVTVEGLLAMHQSDTDFILNWSDRGYSVPAGIWLISKAEIKELVNRYAAQKPPKEKAYLALLKRYDANRNGFLDNAEMEQLGNDPVRQQEQAVQKARSYIGERDKNGDGMLDEDEMTTAGLIGFHPGLSTINVKLASIREILTSCDKNQDRKMDQNEATALFHPSFVFSKRPPLPLSLQKFDLDKDGWLNREENAAVKRAMEEKLK